MDWRDIPVFIINRNRLGAMRSMIEWLLGVGMNKLIILDNQSDYPPLLEFYSALPEKVKLMLMTENFGPYVFWQQGVHRALETPYIITDSDLVPASFCPADLVPALLGAIERFPDCGKAGPSLRIDNLPDCYRQAETARRWESQFWEKPLGRGHFAAPLDTTFALYPARAEFTRDNRNIRLGYPYMFEHVPWYVAESDLSEEERYYRTHTSPIHSHWSLEQRQENRVEDTPRVRNYEARPRMLHAGCGDEYIYGWINASSHGRLLDVSLQTDEGGYGLLPLADASVDGIYMGEVFCQIREIDEMMAEFWRVSRDGAMLYFRIPHGSSDRAHMGAHRLWFERSFGLWSPLTSKDGAKVLADWVVEHVWLEVDAALGSMSADDALDRIRHQRNWVSDMLVRLRCIKTHKPLPASRPVDPTLSLVTGRIFPTF